MPKFILSKSKIIEQYDSVNKLGIVSYSFKTNPVVGQILEKQTESMFSVHFINELKLINDKSRVWFIAQALSSELLNKLFSLGIDKFIIENLEDLDCLIKYIEENNKEIYLLLRMKLKENTIRTEKYYVFGIDVNEINKNILKLKDHKLIKKIGIHVHRKTQNVSEWRLKDELSEIVLPEVFDTIDFLDIGGGIPVKYKNISDKILPDVFNKLQEIKEWTNSLGIQLIIEPGRYLSGPSAVLETEIVGIHGNTIVVDASVYNASPDTLIVPIKLLVEGEVEQGRKYIIKGITPCSTDIFRYSVYFNKEPKVGGKIRFLNAGAYNFHTEFCELDKIETKIVDKHKIYKF